jgi:hypothetical protein
MTNTPALYVYNVVFIAILECIYKKFTVEHCCWQQPQTCLLHLSLVYLGCEVRASNLQSRCSNAWPIAPVHLALVICKMQVSQSICQGWLWTMILLILTCQTAGITGVSHWLAPGFLHLLLDWSSCFVNNHTKSLANCASKWPCQVIQVEMKLKWLRTTKEENQ